MTMTMTIQDVNTPPNMAIVGSHDMNGLLSMHIIVRFCFFEVSTIPDPVQKPDPWI